MIPKPKEAKRAQRIAKERTELKVAPWQFAPSEVDDGRNPYPESTAGFAAWEQAKKWRAEIRAEDPHYFD
jgi:hypothetical protein